MQTAIRLVLKEAQPILRVAGILVQQPLAALEGGAHSSFGSNRARPEDQVPDLVPDSVHFPAFWCSLVQEVKTLSQVMSARCTFVHIGAIFSAGF